MTIKDPGKAPTEQKAARKTYVAPRVRFVEIEVEEALLSICKSGSAAGPTGACAIPCYNDGS